MKKSWYIAKLSEVCDEIYEVIRERTMCQNSGKVMVSVTKKQHKKAGLNEEFGIPVMKGFPKIEIK